MKETSTLSATRRPDRRRPAAGDRPATRDAAARGQVDREAAALYERFFVPALFAQWAQPVLDSATVTQGARVLDVACGTGVLARAAAQRVGTARLVVGIDPNEAMLAVAADREPAIDWRTGCAERIDFDDASFDAVLCQFGLMFFNDRQAGLREMMRVLHPGGTLAVSVWDTLERSPGFAALAAMLDRIVGTAAGDALRVPFSLGHLDVLRELFDRSGMSDVRIDTHPGTARFPSLESWIRTNVRGWAFSDLVSDARLQQLVDEAGREMLDLQTAHGEVAFAAPAHIVVARPR